MSSAESKSVGQPHRLEALERLVEQAPVLGLPRLITVEHLRSMLASARGRVNDSHRLQMESLSNIAGSKAGEVKESQPTEDDEMGGISVAGDTTINITTTNAEPKAAEAGIVRKAVGGGLRRMVVPLLLGAGLPAAGAAGMAFYQWYTQRPAVVAPVVLGKDWDVKPGISVSDQP